MTDYKLIDAMATLWIDGGGDGEGMVWLQRRLVDAIKAKIKESEEQSVPYDVEADYLPRDNKAFP